jgi:hypothetical protein
MVDKKFISVLNCQVNYGTLSWHLVRGLIAALRFKLCKIIHSVDPAN